MMSLPEKGLYAITDCSNPDTDILIRKTEDILQAGAALLQYRNKSNDVSLKKKQAKLLQRMCAIYNIPFIINDDIELARKLRADGVHLGRDDTACKKARIILGPDSIIGVSCYNDLTRAKEMQKCGASYVAFGAFFSTQTKKDTIKADRDLLNAAKCELSLPVVAIGGITPENGKTLVDAGADFLAVISSIYQATDSKSATQSLVKLFN